MLTFELKFWYSGDTIIHQGAHGDTFYIISDGVVEISVTNQEGENSVVREMGKGNYFGEMALLSNSDDKRSATVRCKTRVACYTLDREPFRKLIGNVAEKVNWFKLINRNEIISILTFNILIYL